VVRKETRGKGRRWWAEVVRRRRGARIVVVVEGDKMAEDLTERVFVEE